MSFFFHHHNSNSTSKAYNPTNNSLPTIPSQSNSSRPTQTINMSSISSTSSLTSSSTSKPFRSIYAKDARGHDLSESYARKYGSATITAPIPIPSISRLVYAKDARGVELSSESYQAEEFEGPHTAPIVGDDGMPRNPYDHGQRERTLAYWSELRSGASSLRSSSVSFMSAFSK